MNFKQPETDIRFKAVTFKDGVIIDYGLGCDLA